MQAPDWYDAWCEDAFETFRGKQERLLETYRLDSWERYDYDANAATLTFSDGGQPRVIADMQVLGSIGDDDWLWGWANANWPTLSVEGLKPLHAFGVANGIEELTEFLTSDDLQGLGWMLAAIATRVLDAEGAYRAPTPEGGAVYLLLRSLEFVS